MNPVKVLSASPVRAAITVVVLAIIFGAAPSLGVTERYVFERYLDSSQFNVPAQVAIDDSGNLWVADPQNNRIVLFPADNSRPKFFSALSCPSTVTGCIKNPWTLNGPRGVAVAVGGDLWISDTVNNEVVEIDSTGTVVAFAGVPPTNVVCGSTPPITNCPTTADPGYFVSPWALAVDHLGNLYVLNAGNSRVQKFASGGTLLTTWGSYCVLNADGTQAGGSCNSNAPGALALGDGQFGGATGGLLGIAVDSLGNVYVSDTINNRIQQFDTNGTFLAKTGAPGTGDGQVNVPGGLAVDFQDNLYVADMFNHRIQKLVVLGQVQQSSSGTQFTTFFAFLSKGGSLGRGQGQFTDPVSIAAFPKNLVEFCELFNASLALAGLPGDMDCRGVAVSEDSNQRVQILSERDDTDNDSITDEVDLSPTSVSNAFSNASIPPGFTTTGNITSRGDQTFVLYGDAKPATDWIHIRTESFGGANPLTLTWCGPPYSLSLPPSGGHAGGGADIHCSTTPTVLAEAGPVGFKFVGIDGTVATATLNTGDSLSVNPSTSQVNDISGNVTVLVGTKSVSLTPGQETYVDQTPPTITASS